MTYSSSYLYQQILIAALLAAVKRIKSSSSKEEKIQSVLPNPGGPLHGTFDHDFKHSYGQTSSDFYRALSLAASDNALLKISGLATRGYSC